MRECREKLPESEWQALTLGLEGTKLELDLIIYARPVKPVFQVGSFLMKMSDDAFKKIFLGLTVFKEAKLSIPVS